MSVFTKIIDGIHHIFVGGQHAVEQVKLFIEARPGLKADLDKFFNPIKDAVLAALQVEKTRLEAGGIADVPGELKKAIPSIAATAGAAFKDQATHAGNIDLLVSLAMAAGEAAMGL